MRFFSIDIETTGLDPETCQVLQIGAVYTDLEDPTQKGFFEQTIYRDLIWGEPYAIKMNIDLINKSGAVSEERAIELFREFITRHSKGEQLPVVGKNLAVFDFPFLEKIIPDIYKMFDRRIIDVGSMFICKGYKRAPSLLECKVGAGLPEVVAHTALTDAEDVANLVRYKMEILD